jgi:hypothetical protein
MLIAGRQHVLAVMPQCFFNWSIYQQLADRARDLGTGARLEADFVMQFRSFIAERYSGMTSENSPHRRLNPSGIGGPDSLPMVRRSRLLDILLLVARSMCCLSRPMEGRWVKAGG